MQTLNDKNAILSLKNMSKNVIAVLFERSIVVNQFDVKMDSSKMERISLRHNVFVS